VTVTVVGVASYDVAPERLDKWLTGFGDRHGATETTLVTR
jgi:hypothetical protein